MRRSCTSTTTKCHVVRAVLPTSADHLWQLRLGACESQSPAAAAGACKHQLALSAVEGVLTMQELSADYFCYAERVLVTAVQLSNCLHTKRYRFLFTSTLPAVVAASCRSCCRNCISAGVAAETTLCVKPLLLLPPATTAHLRQLASTTQCSTQHTALLPTKFTPHVQYTNHPSKAWFQADGGCLAGWLKPILGCCSPCGAPAD